MKKKKNKDGDRVVVHEAIGGVGIKVGREADRKEKGDPMQIS
jgi:threonine dehydrogenase-like Zn-dependent dehydrogenase